jgi:predicted alpha-1,6-mannanase (GH76 family)
MNLIDNVATTMTEISNADREQIDNFDGQTRYNGLLNAWVQYEFNEPTPVSAYAIGLTTSANRDRRPACWELMASDDGEQWVTLDIQHNAASMAIDAYEQRYELGQPGANVDYAGVADRLMRFCEENLERRQGTGGIYWICDWSADPQYVNEDWGGYWWAAHGIDNYLDNYERTQLSSKLSKLQQMVNGTRARNGNTLINHFYDDMEWMALALLRGCQMQSTLNRQYYNQVVILFNDIVGGWSDVDGGGIHWNKNKTGDGKYKTSCSNGPAMILAARLYQLTQEQKYLDWALRIYEYMRDHNRFPDGVVKDNATNENHEVTFSYNQGTWVGGLLELYKITGEEVYRQTATDLLDLLMFGKWYSPKGIMNERQNYNQDDGGMFKGIFVRYLTEWIISGCLDADRQFRYAKWLLEQARSAALVSILKPEFIINPYWNQQYPNANVTHDTSRQQTGMMLFEAVCRLQRAGLLSDSYGLANPNIGRAFRFYRLNITETQNSGDVMLGSFKLYGPQSTGIATPRTAASPAGAQSYDLLGRPGSSAPLLIRNGRKYINK